MQSVKLDYQTQSGEDAYKAFDVLDTNDTDIKAFVAEFNLYTTNTVTAAYKRADYEQIDLD